MKRRFLLEVKLFAGLVPKFLAIGKYLGSYDAIHHDNAIGSKHGKYLLHDVLQTATVPANEDGIGG
jgi:hypothetical protein